MKKLIHGIVNFRKEIRPTCKDSFARLALGQTPDTLFIACSDSRVVPNLFASSNPGDLFVIRNVGNLVPPCTTGIVCCSDSETAAIEYSLLSLPVTEIIVCGHSECGAMEALASENLQVKDSALAGWLQHGARALTRMKAGCSLGSHLEPHNQLSQINVLEQLENLKTYPLIHQRLNEGRLRLHGWWFDIRDADVYAYESSDEQFHLIDENYAQELIDRSGFFKESSHHAVSME